MMKMIGFTGRPDSKTVWISYLNESEETRDIFGNGDLPDVDVVVAGSFHLAPQQKRVFGLTSLFVFFLFDGDVLNLESV